MLNIDREGIVKLTCRLVEKDTTNPPGNEYLVKDIILESLKKLGATIKIIGSSKRPNILGSIGSGRPVIALLAHMDIVPPGDGWRTDPFKPVIKSGRIYGRGVVDNKGPYAASWAAVKAVLESRVPFKGTIILGAVADEERGSDAGVKLLLKRRDFKPDYCLIPDGGGIDEIVIGEKGMLWLEFISKGRQAHGSSPHKGVNAVENLSRFMLGLKNISFGPRPHPAFTKTTFNWARIEGGSSPNIVPALCRATADMRYPLGITKAEILSRIDKYISEFNRKFPQARISRGKPLQVSVPHLVAKDSHLVKSILKVCRQTGHPVKTKTIGGNSDAKSLFLAGIPAVSHSPEAGNFSAHQANEFVNIDNLVICAQLWAKLIMELLTPSYSDCQTL